LYVTLKYFLTPAQPAYDVENGSPRNRVPSSSNASGDCRLPSREIHSSREHSFNWISMPPVGNQNSTSASLLSTLVWTRPRQQRLFDSLATVIPAAAVDVVVRSGGSGVAAYVHKVLQ
jgi:hypothetical protein